MRNRVTVVDGWQIRDYNPGDLYATIYCPHGKPVEVINTMHKPIDPDAALRKWLAESQDWLKEYCYH